MTTIEEEKSKIEEVSIDTDETDLFYHLRKWEKEIEHHWDAKHWDWKPIFKGELIFL